ncbi:hypothetical protein BJ508DRAFT_376853 [Ascobolus immersus RN42]|uniref:Uncharacterized protein n=1 Tax=Ascobolus immersus RN42 TaxID=1160509 RepID=A0A3N4I651_ASCIM|nr:hypothetical protein BJ508DRAFT_376853 [Ascobolus immersus RN42]
MSNPDPYNHNPTAPFDPFADTPLPRRPNPAFAPTAPDNLTIYGEGVSFTPSYNILTILCIVAISLIFVPFLIYWCLYGSCCRRHVWRRHANYQHKRLRRKEIKREEMKRHERLQAEERQREQRRQMDESEGRMRYPGNSIRNGHWKTRCARNFTWSGPPPADLGGPFQPTDGHHRIEHGANGWTTKTEVKHIPATDKRKEKKWWWQVWFAHHPKQSDLEEGGSDGPQSQDAHDYPGHDNRQHRRRFLGNLFGGPPSTDSFSPPPRIISTTGKAPPVVLRELSPRPIEEEDTGTILTHSPPFYDSDGSDVDQSSTIRCSTRKIIPTASEAIKPQIVPIYAEITKPRPVALRSTTTGFAPRFYLLSKIANWLSSDGLADEINLYSRRQQDIECRAAFRSISAPCGIVYRPPAITRKVQTSQHGDYARSISSGGSTPLDASVPTYSALFAQGLTRRLEYLEEPVVMRQTVDFPMPPMGSTPAAGIVMSQDDASIQQFVEALRRKLEWWKGQTLRGERNVGRNTEGWTYPSARVVGEEEFVMGYFEGQRQESENTKPFDERQKSSWNENGNKPKTPPYQLKDARSKPQVYSQRGTELSFRTALSYVSVNEAGLPDEDRGRTREFMGSGKTGKGERKEGNTDVSPVVLRSAENEGKASERDGIDLG